MNIKTVYAALLLFCSCPTIAVEPAQSLQDIRDTVSRFIASRLDNGHIPLHIEVGRIDTRLRLKPCTSELTPYFPSGNARAGNVTVGVRCQAPNPWSLFVPVRIKLNTQVVVLTRPVPIGSTLTEEDIGLAERDTGSLVSGYFTDPAQVLGKQLKQPLGIGHALNKLAISAPKLVRRGERVVLLAVSAGLEVRMDGKLMMDGAEGDYVRVRNLSSKRIVEGIVTRNGAIKVRM